MPQYRYKKKINNDNINNSMANNINSNSRNESNNKNNIKTLLLMVPNRNILGGMLLKDLSVKQIDFLNFSFVR